MLTVSAAGVAVGAAVNVGGDGLSQSQIPASSNSRIPTSDSRGWRRSKAVSFMGFLSLLSLAI